ncbi:ChaN family lipoprotein [Sulfitobacter sp. S190]|uniref:ChaN family lipoprotein n=1 Tax=Sulfitobacter sp. S190 TaxID=2867022 RepID=UPI0038FC6FF3
MPLRGYCDAPPAAALVADVIVLGEQHDNPAHHRVQSDWTGAIGPAAIVFEMLTPQQAARATPNVRDDIDTLDAALGWSAGPWPDFAMYYPIFAAAPEAVIFGAQVLRDEIDAQLEKPIVSHPLARKYGLDKAADPDQQAAREALQAEAHCNALPAEMLPMMVDAQRLRDMALADAAVQAHDLTGGPVVVITGNGHAREDWGVPALLRQARPDLKVFALGQGEGGNMPDGGFAAMTDADAPPRGDPCAAFRK